MYIFILLTFIFMTDKRKRNLSIIFRERKVLKRRRIIAKRLKRTGSKRSNTIVNSIVIIKDPVPAPADFRFIDNPDDCIYFFNSIRNKENCSIIRGYIVIRISLTNVKEIDFATISILKSILEESRYYNINFKGNLPKDPKCARFLVDSGFLNNLYDVDFNEIKFESNGKHFSFEKKQGKLTVSDYRSFNKISEESYAHIFNVEGFFDGVIVALKEIGGNAIEWSDSYNKQWQIGVLLEDEKVIINVSDLGKGILETLYIRKKLKIIDFMFIRNDLDILERAFERKYGSLSQEINRNRGLPSIKFMNDNKNIDKLVVCTNNVFLDFRNRGKSAVFKYSNLNFSGTFYQWELNKTCI